MPLQEELLLTNFLAPHQLNKKIKLLNKQSITSIMYVDIKKGDYYVTAS